jgi:predicted Zn-dependent peptidase
MTPSTYRRSTLASGITLLTEAMADRHSLSLGVWVRSGARDEPLAQLGITHFIEHMVFKGTERRDARAIAQSLESLGGSLDAFTAREEVCYYARALAEHLPQVVDVLSDIVCRSRFAPAEVDKEKSVVHEEIFSCEDNPEDKINEMLSGQVWSCHALGQPILGTVETVNRLGPEALRAYHASRHRAERLVIVATGAIEHDQVADEITRHFDAPQGDVLGLSEAPPPFRTTLHHEVRADLQQLHLALGTRGVAYSDAERFPIIVLATLLGGGMSSRLFQSVREDAGLAYSVFSTADFHRDAGMITIQLGVSPERGREALARVRSELEKLCEEGPSEEEVESARSQLKGGILMGQESVSNRMYQLAHEEIYLGTTTTPEEQVARVKAVSREQVAGLARRLLRPEQYALAALGPAPGGELGERDWPGH